ncbi:MAG: hypothetical protein K2K75_02880, partial [Muribaculaceae bacterium]|nr:hypothetical protein [Muribaculaceae bacterium]
MKIYPFSVSRFPLREAGAFVAAFLATGVTMAQGVGTAGYTDPLAPGYLYRASRMLSTGNPLGAKDQTAATADDFEFLSPEQQAEWLAEEGSALFEREDAACVDVLRRLVAEHPANEKSTQALLTLGDWYWYHKDWHEAIDEYAKVDLKSLGTEQRPLYSYRKALAYIRCGMPECAAPLLASIATEPGYTRVAKYYTAYIHYLDKDYDTAYAEFSAVSEQLAESGERGQESRVEGQESRGRN